MFIIYDVFYFTTFLLEKEKHTHTQYNDYYRAINNFLTGTKNKHIVSTKVTNI